MWAGVVCLNVLLPSVLLCTGTAFEAVSLPYPLGAAVVRTAAFLDSPWPVLFRPDALRGSRSPRRTPLRGGFDARGPTTTETTRQGNHNGPARVDSAEREDPCLLGVVPTTSSTFYGGISCVMLS